MPTYYVEDYDGERNEDAVERIVLSPATDAVVSAKVVEASSKKDEPKKSAQAETKG